MPGTLFIHWIICWVLICKSTNCANLSDSYWAICRSKLEWTGFFIHSAFSHLYHSAISLSGHSARRACPEMQNPHFKKQRKTFPLGRRSPAGQMSGDWLELALTHRLQRSLLSWRVLVHSCLWILRLCLWLRAEWQGWEAWCEDGRFGIRGTKKIGVWCYGYRF